MCKRDNTTHAFDLGGTPVESYFSPTDNVEQAILDELGAATESVYFAMFFLTSDPIGDLLVSKAAAGVTVSGIFDAVGATNAYSQDEKLCAAGLPIKVETFGGKVHDKFAVIDVHGPDPRVITGSYNWTTAGAESNDENTLIIHDAATAQAYYQEYLRLYEAIPEDAMCSRHSAESGMPACQRRDRQRLRRPDRRRRRQLPGIDAGAVSGWPGQRRRRQGRYGRPGLLSLPAGCDGHRRGCDRGGGPAAGAHVAA